MIMDTNSSSSTRKVTFKSVWHVLVTAVNGFMDDKVTKLSASLAYATVFSLAPFFIVLIFVVSYFFAREAVEGQVYTQLSTIVGSDIALRIQDMIRNAAISNKSVFSTILGVVVVFVSATSVFAEIQDSLNIIWGIKPKPKKSWLKFIQNRFLSFSLIVSIGFVLLVSLSVNSIIDGFHHRLSMYFPNATVNLIKISTFITNFIVTGGLFALIFKMLPDAKIKLKDVSIGALVTTLLFLVGKVGISYYISNSTINTTYGAAASIIMLLVWVYYSSFILYFGAEFTKAWALELGGKIYPDQYAVSTKIIEIQQDGQPLEAINKTELDHTNSDDKS